MKSARLKGSWESGQWRIPGRNHVYELSLGRKARVIPGWGLAWGCYQAEERAVAKAQCEEEDCELESVACAEWLEA